MSMQLAYSEYEDLPYVFEHDPLATFKMILGEERLQQYRLNKFPIELAYKLINEDLPENIENLLDDKSENEFNTHFNDIIGYEFNTYVIKTLKEMDAQNIRPEVKINTRIGLSSIDCIATFKHAQQFTRVLPNLNEEPFFIKGVNTFEIKATKKLKNKAVKQAKKANTIYPNNNVVILADTKVLPGISKTMFERNTNLIRSDVTKKDLVINLLNIQRQIRMFS